MCDLEPDFDLLLGAAPHRVFVLDAEHASEPALVHGVDQSRPVDLAEPRHSVSPPADVPWVVAPDGLAWPAIAGTGRGVELNVLGLGVWDVVEVGLDRSDWIDAHPEQVRRV